MRSENRLRLTAISIAVTIFVTGVHAFAGGGTAGTGGGVGYKCGAKVYLADTYNLLHGNLNADAAQKLEELNREFPLPSDQGLASIMKILKSKLKRQGKGEVYQEFVRAIRHLNFSVVERISRTHDDHLDASDVPCAGEIVQLAAQDAQGNVQISKLVELMDPVDQALLKFHEATLRWMNEQHIQRDGTPLVRSAVVELMVNSLFKKTLLLPENGTTPESKNLAFRDQPSHEEGRAAEANLKLVNVDVHAGEVAGRDMDYCHKIKMIVTAAVLSGADKPAVQTYLHTDPKYGYHTDYVSGVIRLYNGKPSTELDVDKMSSLGATFHDVQGIEKVWLNTSMGLESKNFDIPNRTFWNYFVPADGSEFTSCMYPEIITEVGEKTFSLIHYTMSPSGSLQERQVWIHYLIWVDGVLQDDVYDMAKLESFF